MLVLLCIYKKGDVFIIKAIRKLNASARMFPIESQGNAIDTKYRGQESSIRIA